jgi:2-polyprenyl-3-methyl-5-hydroxy-6-metoxy-1,4-benzoquinol methylase
MNPTADMPMTYEPEDVVSYHGKLAEDWENRYQKKSFQARIEVLEECLQGLDLAGKEWLDAGCGTGTLSRYLAAKGCRVTGVDASPRMIEVAREQAGKDVRSAQMRFDAVQKETIAQLPNAEASLDGILCSSVLEYMPNVERCLTSFARVIKPGGLLLVSVPNAQSVVRRAQVSAHKMGRLLGRSWLDFIEYSRNEYSTSEFEALLRSQSFEVKTVITFGSPLPHWMQRQRFGGSLLMFLAVRK